jgi:hypothetical protein
MARPASVGIKEFKNLLPIIVLIMIVTLVILAVDLHEIESVEEAGEEFRASDPRFTQTTNYSAPNQVNPMRPVINEVTGENKTAEETNIVDRLIEGLMFGAILLAIAVPAAFGIYFLYKMRKRITLKLLFSVALGTVSVATLFIIMFFLYYNLLFLEFNVFYSDLYTFTIIVPISLIMGIAIIFGITSKRTTPKIRNICLLFLSGLIATFLVIVLPTYVIVPLIVGLVIWDLYATKSGPIKGIIDIIDKDEEEKKKARRLEAQNAAKAAQVAQQASMTGQASETPSAASKAVSSQTPPPEVPVRPPSGGAPLSRGVEKVNVEPSKVVTQSHTSDLDALQLFGLYDTDKFSIGLGDLIFYSVLTAMTMRHFLFILPFFGFYTSALGILISFYVAIFIGVAVLAGFLKTVQMLEKNYVLPGLPISMCIGLGCIIVFLLVLEILNVIFYGYFAPFF